MPLLPSEELSYSTVKITSSNLTGPLGTGTGFFYNFTVKGHSVPVLVTNRHVINGATETQITLHLRGSNDEPLPGAGMPIRCDHTPPQGWITHPDPSVDLAILPINPVLQRMEAAGHPVFLRWLGEDLLPTTQQVSDFGALEEIIMIGYPTGLADTANNLPIFRRGITATHPARDFGGSPEFMIDCACYPGSSGSPVFLYSSAPQHGREGGISIGGTRVIFLGILYSGPIMQAQGKIVFAALPTGPTAVTNLQIHLGKVIKADRLRDFAPQIAALVPAATTPP